MTIASGLSTRFGALFNGHAAFKFHGNHDSMKYLGIFFNFCYFRLYKDDLI